MLGAIIGDIVGSRFEFNNVKSKSFKLFTKECSFTDDTICTVAVADAILSGKSYRDSDTIGAITGGIAEAMYGVPVDLKDIAMSYLPDEMKRVINRFYIEI